MTRSDQLRQALEPRLISPELLPVYEAARFALRVWEGDEQLVEKVAMELWRHEYGTTIDPYQSEGFEEAWVTHIQPMARAVLAAITQEEQK